MEPHRCPVCSGKGIVPNGFYLTDNDWASTTDASPETCRSCNGTGVVWWPDYKAPERTCE